jgi:4-alpha-glucanotransferase
MPDELLAKLATRAGISIFWRDQAGAEREVSPDTLRAILYSLGFPARDDSEVGDALAALEGGAPPLAARSRFVTTRVGQPVTLPVAAPSPISVEATLQNGTVRVIRALESRDGDLTLPAFTTPGYHRVHLAGGDITVATAPARCLSFPDLNQGKPGWGLAAQVYSLRSENDCGIGDLGGVTRLAQTAARRGADFLAISPIHALFGAAPDQYSPYSPSTRLFFNPLYADPALVLPEALVIKAIAGAGLEARMRALSAAALIDWPTAHEVKHALFKAAYKALPEAGAEIQGAFVRFRDQASTLLKDFALFEALHANHLARGTPAWNWRDWQPGFRRPEGAQAQAFANAHTEEIDYQIFLQWMTGRCFGEAQRACRDSGMKAGLIADLAIGVDPSGAESWSRQDDVLQGLTIGAPPDYYAADGQNWGLTAFSPRGLAASGYAPFIDTLRANLRHSGGVRIDHAMGMNRLWLIPEGAGALEGAYVEFPSEILFRLVALESWRHDALIIGEDLGTLPIGFQDYLGDQGVAGMRVLRFERDGYGFRSPGGWSAQAAAMTATHDMIATAGWWKGADFACETEREKLEEIRAWDRGLLWAAFTEAGVARGERPAPDNAAPVAAAALAYIARTPCAMKLATLEDALASDVQPNVPGTTVEKPNWRHRFATPAAQLLDDPATQERLALLGPPRD